MTLNTQILILGPVDPEEVYNVVNRMIGGGASTHVKRYPGTIANGIGQGLDAILNVDYATDEDLLDETASIEEEVDAEVENGADRDEARAWMWHWPPVPYFLKISLDTGYGFREDGANCQSLHGWIITKVNEIAEREGTSILWLNEFTGHWNEGLNGLREFANPAEITAINKVRWGTLA